MDIPLAKAPMCLPIDPGYLMVVRRNATNWLRRIADSEYLRRYGWEPSVIRNEKEFSSIGNGSYIGDDGRVITW